MTPFLPFTFAVVREVEAMVVVEVIEVDVVVDVVVVVVEVEVREREFSNFVSDSCDTCPAQVYAVFSR